jgi:Caspase domain
MKKSILLAAVILASGVATLLADSGRGVTTVPDATDSPLKVGRQFLVVIAIDKYSHWMALHDPVKDAHEIRDILISRYCIDELRELYDGQATKANIIRLLVELQREVRPDDSVLIFYSGHGHLDRKSDTGFWIPVNAGTDVYEQLNWLPHSQLKGLISQFAAKHVFVVSDSCFAGDLLSSTRSMPPVMDAGYFQEAYLRVSRQVLASGATGTVPDTSDFAFHLKSALKRNRSRYLDTIMLYDEIRLGMKSTMPLLGALGGTGHQEGASFLLFLKEGSSASEKPVGAVEVESGTGGLLYLDDALYGEIGRGTSRLTDIEAGEHTIRLVCPDGVSEEKAVAVEEQRTKTVSFIRALKPDARPAGALRVEAGYEAFFPVGPSERTIGVGNAMLARVLYSLPTSVGMVGVGILTGAIDLATSQYATYDYRMLCFPAGIDIRCESSFSVPFFIAFDVATGAMISQISFTQEGMQGITTAKIFAASSLSAGWLPFDNLRIALGIGGMVIFFDNNPFTAVSPSLQVEYAFVAPNARLR